MRSRRPRAMQGMTMIELMVVLAVLSVLAALALPLAEMTHKRTREYELRGALVAIRSALDDYKQAYDEGKIQPQSGSSGYPKTLGALVEGVEDVKSPQHSKLFFLRRVPRDPLAASDADPKASWGLRSYASPPDDPQAGEDVFDVYSRSAAIGLNGIPYKQW